MSAYAQTRNAALRSRDIRIRYASEALDRAHAIMTAHSARPRNPLLMPRHPEGYPFIGMCCGCGYLGFIRLCRAGSVCSDCEGVPRPVQPGERIGPRSARATTRRKADAA